MKKRLLRIVNTGKYGPGIDASKGVFGVEKSSMGDIDSKVIIHSSDYQEIFGALKEQLCSTSHILSFSMSVLISSFLGISFSVSLTLSTSMSDHHLFFFFFC